VCQDGSTSGLVSYTLRFPRIRGASVRSGAPHISVGQISSSSVGYSTLSCFPHLDQCQIEIALRLLRDLSTGGFLALRAVPCLWVPEFQPTMAIRVHVKVVERGSGGFARATHPYPPGRPAHGQGHSMEGARRVSANAPFRVAFNSNLHPRLRAPEADERRARSTVAHDGDRRLDALSAKEGWARAHSFRENGGVPSTDTMTGSPSEHLSLLSSWPARPERYQQYAHTLAYPVMHKRRSEHSASSSTATPINRFPAPAVAEPLACIHVCMSRRS
jgi:hypothetical protein